MARPPRLTDEARERLLQAHAQIDELTERLRGVHADQIHCREGCTDCCQQDLLLRAVEAAYLLESRALDTLDPTAAIPGACRLLRDGRCAAYEHRPAICRTHGLVLRRQENGADRRHTCEHNFTELDLAELPGDLLLDETHLVLLMDVIDALYCRDTAWRGGRVGLSRLLRESRQTRR